MINSLPPSSFVPQRAIYTAILFGNEQHAQRIPAAMSRDDGTRYRFQDFVERKHLRHFAFGEIDEFDTSFLTYTADGVLCYDQTGEKVDNVQRTVGPDALSNIGKFIPDTIHVRNHLYRKDYEILRSLETYDEFMSPREEDSE